MLKIRFTRAGWHQELHLGAYADWRDAKFNGVELGLKLGFWSLGVRFSRDRTLADRMIEVLKKY